MWRDAPGLQHRLPMVLCPAGYSPHNWTSSWGRSQIYQNPSASGKGGSDGGMLRANRPRGKEWTIRISARLEHESRLG
jgi:hypothetical protein